MSDQHTGDFQEILNQYEQGQLDQLGCTRCSEEQVSVYFDGPREVNSMLWTRVYFYCHACRAWDRLTYPGFPPHFDENRDILGLDI